MTTHNPSPQMMSLTVDEALQQAIAHHQAGRLQEGERLYRAILETHPRHAAASHNLGVLAMQVGKADMALPYFRVALEVNPDHGQHWVTYIDALMRLRQFDAAQQALHQGRQRGLPGDVADALAARLEEQGRSEPSEEDINRLTALFNARNYAETATGAQQLTARFPQHAFGWKVLGAAFREMGQCHDALLPMQNAVTLLPNDAEAHYNLSLVLHELGRRDEAEASCRRALQINPDYTEALCNLGNILNELGRLDEAEASCRRALQINPDYVEALGNLGVILIGLGRLDEAQASYGRALQINPVFAEAHGNLGVILIELGRFDEAEVCCRRALQINPDYAQVHGNMGTILRELDRLDEAEASCRRALQIKPDYAEVHSNLGAILKDLGRPREAEASCRRALEIQPDCVLAHSNLGIILREMGRLEDAAEHCRQALRIKPDFVAAHINLSMALLALGQLTEGWEEYEWRWQGEQLGSHRGAFTQPQWRGEAATGRTLLLRSEQGLGDTLQFCRYASLAAAAGMRVILAVQPPLVRLLRSLDGVELVQEIGAEFPPFDFHCPLLSMPLALKTTLSTIPAAASYLHADQVQVDAWRARLAALPKRGFRVGLVWSGTPRIGFSHLAAVDRRRSIDPKQLARLVELSGFHFFSLQKDGQSAPAEFQLTDFMGEMEDFADTAALIANLDLVISVDTAVAHLAGALGKPVWVLDRFDPCWRWLTGRQDSPWYPSLRLFRQPTPGDWQTVIERVAQELAHFSADSAGAT